MRAYITVGISASGKTTWAKSQARLTGAIISCRDDLRFGLTGAKDWNEYDFNFRIERIITNLQKATVDLAVAEKKDVIIADTNLKASVRNGWKTYLEEKGYFVQTVKFITDLEVAIERDKSRQMCVGETVIRKQYEQWLQYRREN